LFEEQEMTKGKSGETDPKANKVQTSKEEPLNFLASEEEQELFAKLYSDEFIISMTPPPTTTGWKRSRKG
jgi:hypothetical protein